jgi:hypothetical protein
MNPSTLDDILEIKTVEYHSKCIAIIFKILLNKGLINNSELEAIEEELGITDET